jgi:Tfp pilus assembly protein PilP
MNLKTGILVVAMAAGTAAAQNANVIQKTRDSMNAVQQKQSSGSNAALGAINGQSAKPSAAAASAPAKTILIQAPAKVPAQAQTMKAAVAAPVAQAKKADARAAAQPASKVVSKVVPQVKATGSKTAAGLKASAKKGEKNAESNSDTIEQKKYAMTGKRDPFLSPVVAQMGGSGCSTGKKCLEINQVALKGVVHQDSGFIAVVTNALNKAYFLRENDPVFNGYVVKITGDSIVFKETYQDRLGKSFTREVTKKIMTPAV